MNPVSLEKKNAELRGNEPPMPTADFEAAIRAVGPERYHDLHPFHHLLHGGKLNKGQVQAWALNRYCYQVGGAAQGRSTRSAACMTANCAAPGPIAFSIMTACHPTSRAASNAGSF